MVVTKYHLHEVQLAQAQISHAQMQMDDALLHIMQMAVRGRRRRSVHIQKDSFLL